jgi:hypothetical protein
MYLEKSNNKNKELKVKVMMAFHALVLTFLFCLSLDDLSFRHWSGQDGLVMKKAAAVAAALPSTNRTTWVASQQRESRRSLLSSSSPAALPSPPSVSTATKLSLQKSAIVFLEVDDSGAEVCERQTLDIATDLQTCLFRNSLGTSISHLVSRSLTLSLSLSLSLPLNHAPL